MGTKETKVLVLAPMTSELRPVVRQLRARRTVVEGIPVHEARRGGTLIVAGRLGVGPARAREATVRLVEATSPERVMVSGIAGGLDPDLPVNTLLLPTSVESLETGRVVTPSPVPGELRGRLQRPVEGPLVTTATLIVDDERLEQLRRRGFVAVDMETSAVGEVCEERGIPWWAFRVVSDRPQDGLVDHEIMGLLKPDGSPDLLAALRLVGRHPSRIPGMVRLARDQGSATTLAAASAIAAAAVTGAHS